MKLASVTPRCPTTTRAPRREPASKRSCAATRATTSPCSTRQRAHRSVRDAHGRDRGPAPDRQPQARARRRHRDDADEVAAASRRARRPAGLLQLHGRDGLDSDQRRCTRARRRQGHRVRHCPARTAPSLVGHPSEPTSNPAPRGSSCGSTSRRSSTSCSPSPRIGVVLAMHPDDPPLPSLLGNDRIMHCVEGFERLVASHRLRPRSPSARLVRRDGGRHPDGDPTARAAHRLRPLPRRDRHR